MKRCKCGRMFFVTPYPDKGLCPYCNIIDQIEKE